MNRDQSHSLEEVEKVLPPADSHVPGGALDRAPVTAELESRCQRGASIAGLRLVLSPLRHGARGAMPSVVVRNPSQLIGHAAEKELEALLLPEARPRSRAGRYREKLERFLAATLFRGIDTGEEP